jgi:hypothetical protein
VQSRFNGSETAVTACDGSPRQRAAKSAISVSGLVVENGFSVGTNTLGAFDVLSGTSTPEPSTPLLFGAGFIGMLSAFRLKSRR